MNTTYRTVSNLNDWKRGTCSTFKIIGTRVLFIQADAEGHHLYEEQIVGIRPNGTEITDHLRTRGTYATAAEARHAGDALFAAAA